MTTSDSPASVARRSGPVALYGSVSTPWRAPLLAALQREGVPSFDPTTTDWSGIDATNGDARQADVNALVAREHEGLRDAACVVFHLDGVSTALASRCEFGFLLGAKVPTFFVIAPTTEGRNYLWGAANLHPHLRRCDTLDEALALAIAFWRG